MPISTRDLSALPDLGTLENLTRSLAMLDAIMSPNRQYRYFHYDPAWGGSTNERMASLDNGSGDAYFLVFSAAGAFLKGFGHESAMTPWAFEPLRVWDGVLDGVPVALAHNLNEPAFDMESTTFCIWRQQTDTAWKRGPVELPDDEEDPDGSAELLWMLDGNPATYVKFAAEYFEKSINILDVTRIYAGESLTTDMAMRLNPNSIWKDVVESAEDIHYPIA